MYDQRRVEELLARWENDPHNAEMRKVRNEVFDVLTLRTIYKLIESGVFSRLLRVISTGKEANVFLANDVAGNPLAVKIYRVDTSEFRRILPYIDGDPRFGRIPRDRRRLVHLWTKKEFKNLDAAFRAGAPVPYPVAVRNNVLVMEFIGDDEGPAPRLRDTFPEDEGRFVDALLDGLAKFYFGAGLVHADLSEYNILVRDSLPVIIDLGQSVPWDHPNAPFFFQRDMRQLSKILAEFDKDFAPDELYRMLKERSGDGRKR
ncbi:MAG: serine protein kinase RIO [Candidatus Diapherotrites archaeon]|nr:serine protein kinase RIO [Candidatus Diapherotrites archaeon]